MPRSLRPAALVLLVIALAAVLSHVCVLPAHAHGGDGHDAHHAPPDGDAVHAASCDAVPTTAVGLMPPSLVARVDHAVTPGVAPAAVPPAATAPAASPPLFLLHAVFRI